MVRGDYQLAPKYPLKAAGGLVWKEVKVNICQIVDSLSFAVVLSLLEGVGRPVFSGLMFSVKESPNALNLET